MGKEGPEIAIRRDLCTTVDFLRQLSAWIFRGWVNLAIVLLHRLSKSVVVDFQRFENFYQKYMSNFLPVAEDQGYGPSGLGMVSMEERARIVSGTLSVKSQPGRGTRITLVVALPGAHEKGTDSPGRRPSPDSEGRP